MTQIRAFVGHSFEEQDASVVRQFLDYFDQLAKSPVGFSWTHAQAAEPKDLAEKVIPLIEASTVFIGICTKKERAIAPSLLKKFVFWRNFAMAREEKFVWKTSDWIIQEIGLATGAKLDLILLVEEDVRSPGGLQGNKEYVKFDRSAPTRSFGKILEMITALSATAPSTALVPIADTGTQPSASDDQRPIVEDWRTPKPGWGRIDYEIALMQLTAEGDEEGMQNINREYLLSDDAQFEDNRSTWAAFAEYWKISFGKNADLAKLQEVAEAHPNNAQIQSFLAQGIHAYGAYARAGAVYEQAARRMSDATQNIRLKGEAAEEYIHADMNDEADRLCNEIKALSDGDPDNDQEIVVTLAKIAKLRKDDQAELGLLERIVELRPSDVDTRFSLAYKYSNLGMNDLSLFHYKTIPIGQRSSMAWNNIGAACDRLSLPGKGVTAFRYAERKGEGLAMTNLGRQFMSAGFHDEVKKLFEEALKREGHHENAWQALSSMKEAQDKEEGVEEAVLKTAKRTSTFYSDFGKAVAKPDVIGLAINWKGPDCALTAKLDNATFVAKGSFIRQLNNMLLSRALAPLSGDRKKTERVDVSFRGAVRGRAIEGTLVRRAEDAPSPSILSEASDTIKVLMVLNDAGDEFRVRETQPGGTIRYYSITRSPEELPLP